jgi:hypothetical protein
MKRVLSQIGIYAVAAVVGFLVVETGYRVHLLHKDPRIQLRPETIAELPVVGVYNRSLWRFDAAEGYQYVDDPVFTTQIKDRRIAGCMRLPPINKYGSPGLAEGHYEDAKIKLAVFGDSFSVFADANNMTWVNHLQRVLQDRIGRSAHVLNFARDGIGLAQMFDIAAIKVPERKPDLAIIAFATNNATLPRIWRIEKVFNGELRVFTTFEPTQTPDLSSSYDTYILHPEAQGAWCEARGTGGPLDKIGLEMIDKYLRFRVPRHSAFTLSRSFLWHRIVHANPFVSAFERGAGAGFSADDLAKDKRLIAAIATLEQSGVPYLLVHLPFYPEVKTGEEYSSPMAARVAQEIGHLSKRPVHALLKHIQLPIPDPERMNHSAENMHPSTWGMQMYAAAVSAIILKSGIGDHRGR